MIKNILKSLGAIIVVILVAFFYISSNLETKEEKEIIPVQVYNIPEETEEKKEIEKLSILSKTGIVQSEIQVSAFPLAAGNLDNFNLKVGDEVNKGEIIGTVKNSPQLDSAKASLDSANESLAILEQIIDITTLTNELDLNALQNQVTGAEISIDSVLTQIESTDNTLDIQEDIFDTQQDSTEVQIEIQEKQQDIAELQQELQELQAELQSLQQSQSLDAIILQLLQGSVEQPTDSLEDILDDIEDVQDEIEDLNDDIIDLTEEINDNSLDLGESQFEIQEEQSNLQKNLFENQILTIQNQITQLNTQIQSTDLRGELALLNLESQVSQIRGQINQALITVNTGNITAPVSGTITDVFVDDGQQVASNTAIVEISNLELLNIEINLTQEELKTAKSLSEITIIDGDNKIDAVITEIDPIANPNTRTISVTISPDDPEDLIANTLVSVEFTDKEDQNSKVPVKKNQKAKVDSKLIIYKGDKTYLPVYKNGEVIYRLVNSSNPNSEGLTTIKAGLLPGDQLILSPRYPIEGTKARITKELENLWTI